jgi:hypothetical protein
VSRLLDKNEIRRQECGRDRPTSLSRNNDGSAKWQRKIIVVVSRVQRGVAACAEGGTRHHRVNPWERPQAETSFLSLPRLFPASSSPALDGAENGKRPLLFG